MAKLGKTNKHLNKMCIRWLDEIEDFRFAVAHLPGSRNPTDPLSLRGFADGDGPAATTGDPDAESQQKLFSRLGRDAPAPAVLAAIRARWASTRSTAASDVCQRPGRACISTYARGGGRDHLPVYQYVYRLGRVGPADDTRSAATDPHCRPLPLADIMFLV